MITAFISLTIPFIEVKFRASFTSILCFIPTFLPINNINPTPIDVTPRPPICISIATTVFPNKLNVSAVSIAISPVTHTALVEVNKASTNDTSTPLLLEKGLIKRNAPIIITIKKPNTISLPGLICFNLFIFIPL